MLLYLTYDSSWHHGNNESTLSKYFAIVSSLKFQTHFAIISKMEIPDRIHINNVRGCVGFNKQQVWLTDATKNSNGENKFYIFSISQLNENLISTFAITIVQRSKSPKPSGISATNWI